MRFFPTIPLAVLAIWVAALPIPAQDEKKPKVEAPKVMATVNGEKILEKELEAAVNRQLRGRRVPANDRQRLEQQVLEYLIKARLVEQYLVENKVPIDAKKVDSTIDEIRNRVQQAGLKFEDALRQQGLTEESMRARLRGQLGFERIVADEITTEKIKGHFEANKAEFDGTEVKASHLLIKLEPTATEQQSAKAMGRIKEIREEIVKGLGFAEAAKKYSEGPSGPKGGDLGFFPRHNRMVEPFAAAAFALKKGGVSQPVKTQFGLHLIQVTDRKPGTETLDDVSDQIKGLLANQLWEAKAAAQRKKSKIDVGDLAKDDGAKEKDQL